MQLESLNYVAKLMKEGFSDNNSVILTAIEYSCNPNNCLICPHFCIFHFNTISNRNHVDDFELLNPVNFAFSNLVSYGQKHANTTKL